MSYEHTASPINPLGAADGPERISLCGGRSGAAKLRVPLRSAFRRGRTALAHHAVAIAVGTVYLFISLTRYSMHNVGIDAAIFYQAISRYAQFQKPTVLIKSVEPFNVLGDHFSPALVVFAPLLRAFPSVLTLLVVQAVLFSISVAVVRNTGSRLGLDKPMVLLISLGYGLSAGIIGAVEFDFHEVSLSVPVLAFALSRLLLGQYKAGLAFLACMLFIREDNAFLIVGVGFVFVASKNFRMGIATILAGVGSFIFITGMVIPYFSYYGKYTYWTSAGVKGGFNDTAINLVTTLSQSLSPGMLPKTLIVLLASFAFLPLRSPWILSAAPLILLRATSPNSAYWILGFHYNAVVSVILAFAALHTVSRINFSRSLPKFSRLQMVRLAFVACIFAVTSIGPIFQYLLPSTYACARCPALEKTISLVPSGKSVAANEENVALLVASNPTFLLAPGLLDSAGNPMRPDWVVVDLRSRARSEVAGWPGSIQHELVDKGYALLRSDSGYLLWHRGPIEAGG